MEEPRKRNVKNTGNDGEESGESRSGDGRKRRARGGREWGSMRIKERW